MRVAIDVSPLTGKNSIKHRVRGIGSYTRSLVEGMERELGAGNVIQFTDISSINTKINLVHFPYFEPFFISLPLRKKYPSVVTIHDLTPIKFPDHFPPGIKGKIKWEIQKRLVEKIDSYIADSHSTKNDLIEYLNLNPSSVTVSYLSCGSEFKKIHEENLLKKVKDKYKLPNEFVLYVGDATWNKNLVRLLNASSEINKNLVIVGKVFLDENFDKSNPWNRDLAEVQKIIKRSEKIHALGYVDQEELVAIYNLATVFAMPSIYEGFGLPILEAMRCSCPVLASREGSIPEIGKSAVYYVDAYNKEDIKRGLLELLKDDRLRDDLAKKGRYISEDYNTNKTIKTTLKAYDFAIASTSS